MLTSAAGWTSSLPLDNTLENSLYDRLQACQDDADKFTAKDQNLARKDTIEVCLDILNRIKAIGSEINEMTEPVREKFYAGNFKAYLGSQLPG